MLLQKNPKDLVASWISCNFTFMKLAIALRLTWKFEEAVAMADNGI